MEIKGLTIGRKATSNFEEKTRRWRRRCKKGRLQGLRTEPFLLWGVFEEELNCLSNSIHPLAVRRRRWWLGIRSGVEATVEEVLRRLELKEPEEF
ncbi:hypothetical protein V6N13_146598 [Hibiscus sabdariffa]